jgi:hypothetical protein
MARKKQRRPVSARKLTTGLVVATVAVAGALTAAAVQLSPVPLVDDRPPANGGTLAFSWEPPTPSTTPTTVALTTRTPADEALSAAVGDGTFDGYDSTAKPEGTIYGGPYAGSCKTLLDPAPVAGTMRRTKDGPASLAVTAWAYSAGGAPAAVQHAAGVLSGCDAPADAKPTMTSLPTPGGNGFVVTSPNGGDGVAWMVWSRGDVVLAVVGTVAKGSGPTTQVRTLADRVDAATSAALATTCVDTSPAAGDKDRNPYLGSYSPYKYTAQVRVPGVSTKVPKFYPTEAPAELGEVVVPDGEPVEGLAPVLLPDDISPDIDFPDIDSADRGTAPVLVDPDDIPVPDGAVSSEPVEPGTAAPAQDLAKFGVLSADKSGPGCGWEFTGSKAPNVSEQELKSKTRKNVEKAFWKLAVAQGDAKLKVADVAAATERYERDLSGWQLYLSYLGQVQDARSAQQVAQSRYDDSVDAYEDAYQRWLDSTEPPEEEEEQPEPEALPSPEPVPTTETPTTPVPDPEPLPPLPGTEVLP